MRQIGTVKHQHVTRMGFWPTVPMLLSTYFKYHRQLQMGNFSIFKLSASQRSLRSNSVAVWLSYFWATAAAWLNLLSKEIWVVSRFLYLWTNVLWLGSQSCSGRPQQMIAIRVKGQWTGVSLLAMLWSAWVRLSLTLEGQLNRDKCAKGLSLSPQMGTSTIYPWASIADFHYLQSIEIRSVWARSQQVPYIIPTEAMTATRLRHWSFMGQKMVKLARYSSQIQILK